MTSLSLSGAAEEDAEIDMGEVELDDTKMHQLSHRELFLSRQYETINASQIRFVLKYVFCIHFIICINYISVL